MSSEFDLFASGYEPGSRSTLKRWLGGFEAFIDAKVCWFLSDIRDRPLPQSPDGRPRVLDFGCGAGNFLKLLQFYGFEGALTGCDVSKAMLKEANGRTGGSVELRHLTNAAVMPFEDGAFDTIVASSVFHHIPPTERNPILEELGRLLAPGGRLYVFEHNPANPLTRWMVSRAPEDKNAVLLSARETEQRIVQTHLCKPQTRYLLFSPPCLTFLRPAEKLIGRIPLGGQYVVTSEKPIARTIAKLSRRRT